MKIHKKQDNLAILQLIWLQFFQLFLSINAIQFAKECVYSVDTKSETCEKYVSNELEDLIEYSRPETESNTPLSGDDVVSSFDCVDELESCKEMIEDHESEWCKPNSGVLESCKLSCGLCTPKTTTIGIEQLISGTPKEIEGIEKVVAEMRRYLEEEVLVEPEYNLMYGDCVNNHELCAFWASVGECMQNPYYMNENCMLACKRCSEHHLYLSS